MNITGYAGLPEMGRAIVGATLTCSATGFPAPSYQWAGPNELYTTGPTIELSVTGSGLVYTCTASNVVGSTTKSIELTVTAAAADGVYRPVIHVIFSLFICLVSIK